MLFLRGRRPRALPGLLGLLLGAALPALAAVDLGNPTGYGMSIALQPGPERTGRLRFTLVAPDGQVVDGRERHCGLGDLQALLGFEVPKHHTVRIALDLDPWEDPSIPFIVVVTGTSHAKLIRRSLDPSGDAPVESLVDASPAADRPQPFRLEPQGEGRFELQEVEGVPVETAAGAACCVIL